jgi:hypothetical protein
MAIIIKPTIAKGQANEFDLSKSDLALVSKVVNDSYFSDQTNWSKVVLQYESAEGEQPELVIFDASEASPKGSFEVSEKARDSWEIKSILIMDFDGGYLKINRGELTVEEFDISLGQVGGEIAAVYTAFNYLTVLRPDGLDKSDSFGWSVAISGSYMVVGAYKDDGADNSKSTSGAAYVFKINGDDTITLLDTLRPDGLDAFDWFGYSVAISGNYIVVNAVLDAGVNNDKGEAGAAYVFKINGDDTITLLGTLRPDGVQSGDKFGYSVAIDGSYIVVGAYQDDGVGNGKSNAGAAYVFKINGDDSITLLETLRPDGLDVYDSFGWSVAISGSYMVVGARGDDDADNNKGEAGAAYVFKINGDDSITLLDTLRPDGLDSNDNFGQSVAISGSYMVVGAYKDAGADNSSSSAGAAYVFKINGDDTITLLDTLRLDDLQSGDEFGYSVAIDGSYMVVCASKRDGIDKSQTGAAYVFKINGDDTITLLNTLSPDELDAYEWFGEFVAISDGYMVVGAYRDDGVGNGKSNAGAAYVFKGVE